MCFDCLVGCFFFFCGYSFGFLFFFFQAEDGIRDVAVTGVQTCALPILAWRAVVSARALRSASAAGSVVPGRAYVNCNMNATGPRWPTMVATPPLWGGLTSHTPSASSGPARRTCG